MKADVSYNDFSGYVAADTSDVMAHFGGDDFSSYENYFELDKERFKLVSIKINGTRNFGVSLVCVDKVKSTPEKEHIVSLGINSRNEKDVLAILFKQLEIVLHDRFDKKYSDPDLNYNEEAHYSDYHEKNFEFPSAKSETDEDEE